MRGLVNIDVGPFKGEWLMVVWFQLSYHWLCVLLYSFLYSNWIKREVKLPKLRCDGKFATWQRNPPFHSICLTFPLEAECGNGRLLSDSSSIPSSSLRAKVLSPPSLSTTMYQVNRAIFQALFLFIALKLGNGLPNKQFPKAKQCAMLINIQANVFQVLLWIIFPSFLPWLKSSCWLQMLAFCVSGLNYLQLLPGRQLSLSPLSALLCLVF